MTCRTWNNNRNHGCGTCNDPEWAVKSKTSLGQWRKLVNSANNLCDIIETFQIIEQDLRCGRPDRKKCTNDFWLVSQKCD